MIPIDPNALKPLAGKYIWWKTPDDAVAMPEQIGDDALRQVLTHAAAGQFNERSWAYWHGAGAAGPRWVAIQSAACRRFWKDETDSHGVRLGFVLVNRG